MINLLGSILPFIPALTSIVGLLLKIFGKSQAEIEEYQDAIKKASRKGSISVDVKDKMDEQKKNIKDRQKDEEPN